MPGVYPQKTVLSLPFRGVWTVANGGVDEQTSHSWGIVNQRFAYDFYITDQEGRTHRGDGRQLADYYTYGQPVCAPADGVVVAVRDGIRDYPRSGTGWVDWRAPDFRGNFVLLRHAEGEYSLLAHLAQGSISVKLGETVYRSQVIGRCGNSGHSTEPHLHFHLQDRTDFFTAIGLPCEFSDFVIDDHGTRQVVKRGYILKGQRVGNSQEDR